MNEKDKWMSYDEILGIELEILKQFEIADEELLHTIATYCNAADIELVKMGWGILLEKKKLIPGDRWAHGSVHGPVSIHQVVFLKEVMKTAPSVVSPTIKLDEDIKLSDRYASVEGEEGLMYSADYEFEVGYRANWQSISWRVERNSNVSGENEKNNMET